MAIGKLYKTLIHSKLYVYVLKKTYIKKIQILILITNYNKNEFIAMVSGV